MSWFLAPFASDQWIALCLIWPFHIFHNIIKTSLGCYSFLFSSKSRISLQFFTWTNFIWNTALLRGVVTKRWWWHHHLNCGVVTFFHSSWVSPSWRRILNQEKMSVSFHFMLRDDFLWPPTESKKVWRRGQKFLFIGAASTSIAKIERPTKKKLNDEIEKSKAQNFHPLWSMLQSFGQYLPHIIFIENNMTLQCPLEPPLLSEWSKIIRLYFILLSSAQYLKCKDLKFGSCC